MDDFEWWRKRVEKLAGKKQEIRNLWREVKRIIPSARIYEKQPWAFDKLVLLSYYIDIYTTAIRSGPFEHIVYIDLFAGSGFNKIEGFDEVVAGSPLLAQMMPRTGKGFDSMILFELDKSRAETLNLLLPKAQVHALDCNSAEALRRISKELKRPKTHFLAFVDPEGIDCEWPTIELLLKYQGDLIINCQYGGLARIVGTFHGNCEESKRESIRQTVTKFYGNKDWESVSPEYELAKGLKEIYLRQVRRFRDEIIVTTMGQEGGGFRYAIVVGTRLTSGGSPWLRGVRDAAERIMKSRHSELQKWIEVYRGKRDCVGIQSSMEDAWE